MNFGEEDDDTCSTVSKACRTGNLELLTSLIAAGNPVDVKDNRDWFPLHEAAYRQGQPDCLECLLQHKQCDVNWKTSRGETALYLASKIGNIDAIKLLLRHGADVNLTTNSKLSPLRIATGKSRLACMKVLIAAGANINQQTYTGDTPLHSAAETGNTDIVRFLLDNGADSSKQTVFGGRTPVFIAAQYAQPDCLKIILEKADLKHDVTAEGYVKNLVDTASANSETPLLIAAQAGCARCIEHLLARGANPHIPCDGESVGDGGGFVPLQMAIHRQHPSCVQILAPVTKQDFDCDEDSDDSYSYEFEQDGDDSNKHPMAMAIANDNIHCIRILLEIGYSWPKKYKRFPAHSGVSVEDETEFFSFKYFQEMSFNVTHYFFKFGIVKASLKNLRNVCDPFIDLRYFDVTKMILFLEYGANHSILDGNGVNQLVVDVIRHCDGALTYALIKYGTPLQFGENHCFHQVLKMVNPSSYRYAYDEKYLLSLIVMCLCSHIPTSDRIQPALVGKIQEASWSLAHASRVRIVRQLISHGSYTRETVQSLNIPKLLEDYLLYKDFDDFHKHSEHYDACRFESIGEEMREEFRKLEVTDRNVRGLMAANEEEFKNIEGAEMKICTESD